jgi:hypothetical protein
MSFSPEMDVQTMAMQRLFASSGDWLSKKNTVKLMNIFQRDASAANAFRLIPNDQIMRLWVLEALGIDDGLDDSV